jgi:hypothetical protein
VWLRFDKINSLLLMIARTLDYPFVENAGQEMRIYAVPDDIIEVANSRLFVVIVICIFLFDLIVLETN